MANITGLVGFNPSSGTSRLLAAYGNDINNVTTGTGYSLNLNGNDCEFEIFLDRVFLQNYNITPKTYDTSTNTWTNKHVGRVLRAKYQQKFKSRIYLGYCQFTAPQVPSVDGNDVIFASRIFYSDLFTGSGNTELTWGIEWGRNGKVYSDTNIFFLETQGLNEFLQQDFKARNIKVGDPLTILDSDAPSSKGELLKTHYVTKVDSAYRLELNTTFTAASSGALLDWWVGSNWFDVSTDDGDVVTGLGENSDRLLVFKLMSLWFYTGSQLRQVKGAPGTSYNRSIINDNFGNTYYFHGSDPKITGIYKYNGVSSVKISRAIDPFIAGMTTANYDNVVAWAEGNELRFYLGDLSTTNLISAITNAVATYNVDTGSWSVDPIADVITAKASWRTVNEEDTYLGTSDDEILQTDDGNSFNTAAISARLETKVYYPSGSEIINEFPYVQIISRNARGVRVKYKLWNNPVNVDSDYFSLGEVAGDKTEFVLPSKHMSASGIQFLFDEMGTTENDWYIEKVSLFYRPDRSRLL